MKTLSLKVPEILDRQLAAAARRQRATKSEVVRRALKEYVRKGYGPGRGSCLDLVADLAGCVEGPGDLSVNEKYMEGFGR